MRGYERGHNRDLTNLDLGRGDGKGVGGRIGKFSFRMRDKNIYDTFYFKKYL